MSQEINKASGRKNGYLHIWTHLALQQGFVAKLGVRLKFVCSHALVPVKKERNITFYVIWKLNYPS